MMSELRTWQGYPALSRPLVFLGVERRWLVLSFTLSVALWIGADSLLSAVVVFAALYGAGRAALKVDPDMLLILKESSRYRARYDPGKWVEPPWHVLVRGARKGKR